MLHLSENKVAVKHSCSARDQILSFSIVFLFHLSTPGRKLDLSSLESVFQKVAFLRVLILIWVLSVDGSLIPRKKMLFQRTEKGVCSRRLGYVWTGPNVFNVFYFYTGWVHCKGQKVYILPSVLNFQRLRNLLGVQLPYSRKLTMHVVVDNAKKIYVTLN